MASKPSTSKADDCGSCTDELCKYVDTVPEERQKGVNSKLVKYRQEAVIIKSPGEADESSEIEEILGVRDTFTRQYWVRWVGFGKEHDSWVNEADIEDKSILREYSFEQLVEKMVKMEIDKHGCKWSDPESSDEETEADADDGEDSDDDGEDSDDDGEDSDDDGEDGGNQEEDGNKDNKKRKSNSKKVANKKVKK